MAFEIVELEKIVEAQYITRSIGTRADELTVQAKELSELNVICLLYTSPSPRDATLSRMPSSA